LPYISKIYSFIYLFPEMEMAEYPDLLAWGRKLRASTGYGANGVHDICRRVPRVVKKFIRTAEIDDWH
jgi:hypothetical protein